MPFRANMGDIRDLCTSHGVPVIFGTQVSNLRGLPPFMSTDPSGLTPDAQLRFHASFNAGESTINGTFASALASFREAAQVLPYHAETHFSGSRAASTRSAAGAKPGRHTVSPAITMNCASRTSSDFNEAILAMDDGHLAAAVDMERVFTAHAPDSLIGYGLILEHLHPSSYGQFLLARGYAEAMRSRALLSPRRMHGHDATRSPTLRSGATAGSPPVDERLAERRTEVLITAWPFQEEEGLVSSVAKSDTLGLIADRATRGEDPLAPGS